MRENAKSLVADLTFEIAAEIVTYSKLLEAPRSYDIAKQLLRCGTSIGANVSEAQHAESQPEFILSSKLQLKRQVKLIIGFALVKYRNFSTKLLGVNAKGSEGAFGNYLLRQSHHIIISEPVSSR